MSVKKVGKAHTSLLYNSYNKYKFNFTLATEKEVFNLEKSYFLEIPEIESEIKWLENYIYKKYDMAGNITNVDREAIENKMKEKAPVISDLFIQEYCDKLLRLLKENDDSAYAIYKEIVYKFDRCDYTDEQMLLQIMDFEDNERKRFEHLKHKFKVAKEEDQEKERQSIPEEVRIAVWRRDDGKCAKCGSRENLEYDHIIPISKGGSNTVRNIELLCEKCNREKHDKIA